MGGVQMTILDLLPPTPYEVARNYAIIMPSGLADRLSLLQDTFDTQDCKVSPVWLADGRAALCADLLTETSPGGMLADLWALIDVQRYMADIEIVDWNSLPARSSANEPA